MAIDLDIEILRGAVAQGRIHCISTHWSGFWSAGFPAPRLSTLS
jgi:hypothetical protein